MERAGDRFQNIFGEPALAHAAAGWQMNAQAWRLTQRLGFHYSSDSRGTHPYIPVLDGEIIACPQLPTTLPALGEQIAGAAGDTAAAVNSLLRASENPLPTGHVYALRADLAVLAAPGLPGRVLDAVSSAKPGTAGAILGFPRNGPFDARAARVGTTQTVITQDAYGLGRVRRAITPIRGLLRPGNSGGPVVDARGRVLATVFAASTGSGTEGGYGVPNAVLEQLLATIRSSAPTVSTGPCAR